MTALRCNATNVTQEASNLWLQMHTQCSFFLQNISKIHWNCIRSNAQKVVAIGSWHLITSLRSNERHRGNIKFMNSKAYYFVLFLLSKFSKMCQNCTNIKAGTGMRLFRQLTPHYKTALRNERHTRNVKFMTSKAYHICCSFFSQNSSEEYWNCINIKA